jgi:hypothetical protein
MPNLWILWLATADIKLMLSQQDMDTPRCLNHVFLDLHEWDILNPLEIHRQNRNGPPYHRIHDAFNNECFRIDSQAHERQSRPRYAVWRWVTRWWKKRTGRYGHCTIDSTTTFSGTLCVPRKASRASDSKRAEHTTGYSTRTWASQYRQNKPPFLTDVYLRV